jgi:hypothetical protein
MILESPLPDLVAKSRAMLNTDGAVLLLIVGVVALAFIGYLLWDWHREWRARQRLQRLRQKGLKPGTVNV